MNDEKADRDSENTPEAVGGEPLPDDGSLPEEDGGVENELSKVDSTACATLRADIDRIADEVATIASAQNSEYAGWLIRPLHCFGFVVGFMASLSTFAGTTSTLIGLLFILLGREAASWFRPGLVERRHEFLGMMGQLSVGLFLGLCLGLGGKYIEREYREFKAVDRLEKLDLRITDLESGPKKVDNAGGPRAAGLADFKQELQAIREALSAPGVLRLQAEDTTDIDHLIAQVKRAAEYPELEPRKQALMDIVGQLTSLKELVSFLPSLREDLESFDPVGGVSALDGVFPPPAKSK